jgi:hypothetical protein
MSKTASAAPVCTALDEATCRYRAKERARSHSLANTLVCERCGSPVPCTLHHRRKRSHMPKDRMWELSNCVMLCGHGTTGCHGWVEHNPDAAAAEGWHVRSWEEPRDVPVQPWYAITKVLLNDRGGYDPWPGGLLEQTISESDPLF